MGQSHPFHLNSTRKPAGCLRRVLDSRDRWASALVGMLVALSMGALAADAVQGDSPDFSLDTTGTFFGGDGLVFAESPDFTLNTTNSFTGLGDIVSVDSGDFTLDTRSVNVDPLNIVFADSPDFTLDTTVPLSGADGLVSADSSDFTLDTTSSSAGVGGIVFADSMDFTLDTRGVDAQVLATPDIVTTIAGKGDPGVGNAGFSGDGGQGTNALINSPRGLALAPDGTIYFADQGNFRIRRIAPNGVITTIAGDGTFGDTGDGGPATSAQISTVLSIALDSSRDVLYFGDIDNDRVRQVDLLTGIINNFAGLGLFGFGFHGDGGPAQLASLAFIEGVAVDYSGNVYIADAGNTRVRKVDIATGIISTIAGNNSATTAGDGGAAIFASFTAPIRVAADVPGNVFVLDQSQFCRVRRIDVNTGIIATVAGGGSNAPANGVPALSVKLPPGADIALDQNADSLFISASNHLYYVDLSSGLLSIVAGTGPFDFSGDGDRAVNTTFSDIQGVLVSYSGKVIVSDSLFNRVRSFTPLYAPAIYEQPTSRTNLVGTIAIFHLGASLKTPSSISFQWKKNGTNLLNGTNLSGATNTLLTLANVQLSDAGDYSVVVTNLAGSVTSALATLTVLAPPSISTQPQSRTNLVGTSATFNVIASGDNLLSYQWRFNGTNISGATGPNYTLVSVQLTNAGNYSVVVTNFAGTVTSAVATLTVLTPPSIVTQPQSRTNSLGTSATFSVVATGTAPLMYQWQFNGTDIPAATGADYTLGSAQVTNVGDYSVAITNLAGGVTSAVASLTVVVPSTNAVDLMPAQKVWKYFPGVSAAPANDVGDHIWTEPLYNDAAWTAGAQLLYIENDALTNPEGFVKTTLLPGAAPYQTYYFRTHFTYSAPLSGVVLTATFMLDDGAVIYLNGFEAARVRMPAGAVTFDTLANTNVANAVVENANIPIEHLLDGDNVLAVEVHQSVMQSGPSPSRDIVWGMKLATLAIITQPESQMAAVGDSASFDVAAACADPLSYQWRFNGTDISGATDTNYALVGVQATNAGNYSVVVTSFAGSVTSSVATLTVIAPPSITTQPQSRTNSVGTSATFRVIATGTAPLNYQ
jgi:hypothetical protein